jgi:hypothetical protein
MGNHYHFFPSPPVVAIVPPRGNKKNFPRLQSFPAGRQYRRPPTATAPLPKRITTAKGKQNPRLNKNGMNIV